MIISKYENMRFEKLFNDAKTFKRNLKDRNVIIRKKRCNNKKYFFNKKTRLPANILK